MAIAYDDFSYYCTLVFTGPLVWPKPEVTTSFGFSYVGEDAGPGPIADQIIAAYDLILQPVTDNEVTPPRVRVENETTVIERPASLTGGADVYSPTANTSILLSKQTAVKGPRGRGRSYFPGLANATQILQTGALTPVALGTLQGFVDAFIEQIETGGGPTPSLTQRLPQTEYEGQKSNPFLPWPSVQETRVSPFVATQRRRMR